MRKVWHILGGLALLIVFGFAALMSGMGPIKNMKINSVDLSKVADGVHKGTFSQGRWNYSVAVTVKDHKIAGVELLSRKDKMFEKLYEAETAKVISAQSPNVDTYSGATVTSKALLKAIENALAK